MGAKRPYTGTKDCPQPRSPERQGTRVFANNMIYFTGGVLQLAGIYALRDKRGKPGDISIHSSWRAFDLTYDGEANSRAQAMSMIDFVVENDWLGLEYIADYATGRYGRGWRCDRQAWDVYRKRTIEPVGMRLIHVEITPYAADHPDAVTERWTKAITGG